MKRAVVVLVLLLCLPSCDGSNPTAPAGTPAPTGSTYSITVGVQTTNGVGIAQAILLMLDGTLAGQTFTVGADGTTTIANATGNMNIEASAPGYLSQRLGVGPPATPGATQSLSFALERDGQSIPPGQHLVGSEIQPGRYYTDPAAGCFWKRLSGLGGTQAETIAARLATWDPLQLIVDILASDLAFETNAACGTWTRTPPHGPQTGIPVGAWLVGAQIPAGTYRSNVSAGCFWLRLSGFSGADSENLAGGGVATARLLEVEILPGDVGFSVDDDCGTWTRVSGAAAR